MKYFIIGWHGEPKSTSAMKEEKKTTLDYTQILKNKSLDFRSKLTVLMLFVEQNDKLQQEEKNCISNICEIIAEKNNELIYAEEKLEEVIHLLSSEDIEEIDNYSHFS